MKPQPLTGSEILGILRRYQMELNRAHALLQRAIPYVRKGQNTPNILAAGSAERLLQEIKDAFPKSPPQAEP